MATRTLVLIVVLATMGTYGPVRTQSLDMTRFNSLIEKRTCNDYLGQDWQLIVSMYVWDDRFRWYVAPMPGTDSDSFEARIRDGQENQNYNRQPIVDVNLDRSFEKYHYFETIPNEIQYNSQQKGTRFFYPLDRDNLLYIFNYDNQNDLYAICQSTNPTGPCDESFGETGLIPLIHLSQCDAEKQVVHSYPCSFISNVDFSYRTGSIQTQNPITFRYEQIYYFGFNQKLDKVYLAKNSKLFNRVPNYLPAKLILATEPKWHSFRCYSNVYLVTGSWVLIFPYFNLTELIGKFNNPAVLEAPMLLMHINSMFRCRFTETNVPIPAYPTNRIRVFLQNSDDGSPLMETIAPDDFPTDSTEAPLSHDLKSLKEKETCQAVIHWLEYSTIGSVYVWHTSLEVFYDDKAMSQNGFPVQWLYPNGKDYQQEPIYGIHFWLDAEEKYKFYPNEHPELMAPGQFLAAFQYDLLVPYNYLEYQNRKQEILATKKIPTGTVPLLHFTDKDPRYRYRPPQNAKCIYFLKNDVRTTFINNVNFTYERGYLGISPALVQSEHSFHFGFDSSLSQIYFAKSLTILSQSVRDYLPAKSLLTGPSNWHPFLCFDYVYIYTDQWILMFPHIKLEDYPNQTYLIAPMSVMHRNTFFRCSKEPSSVPVPRYPSDVSIQTGSPDSARGDSSSLLVWTIMCLLVFGALGLAVILAVVVRRRRRSLLRKTSNKFRLQSKSKTQSMTKKSKKITPRRKSTPTFKSKSSTPGKKSSQTTTPSESKFSPSKSKHSGRRRSKLKSGKQN